MKSEFPPLDQWEEMEIVEDIGTADEHADPFYRWNNYGIEVHEDGLCQAYVIIQDPEEGEIPKMVSEGFSSPEAVIEFFMNTEGEKKLTDSEEPEGAAEAEGEPAPMGDPGALDGPAEEVPPAEEAPAENAPEAEPSAEEKEAPAPEKKEEGEGEKEEKKDEGEKDEKKDDEKDKDKKDVKKSEPNIGPAPAEPESSVTKSAEDELPPIKSFAEMRAEWYANNTNVCKSSVTVEHTQTTVTKTAATRAMGYHPSVAVEMQKTTTVTKSAPVKKSIKFGELPSWEDIRNGYTIEGVGDRTMDSIFKSTSVKKQGELPDEMPEANKAPMDVTEGDPVADEDAAGVEAPGDAGVDIGALIQQVAVALGKSPEEVQRIMETQGPEALIAMLEQQAAPADTPQGSPMPDENARVRDEGSSVNAGGFTPSEGIENNRSNNQLDKDQNWGT